MSLSLTRSLSSLSDSAAACLTRLRRGLEKESLRIDADGMLAQTPHPEALGAALTHPHITTDFSEALIELVTGVHTDIPALLGELEELHRFTYLALDDETLWVNSMPCPVAGEGGIPIARYGDCNVARLKQIYRAGLSHRYGSLMQTVAGVHYNWSLPEAFWADYAPDAPDPSGHYFGLIRNFHRHAWLLCYLFGASPAVCRSFVRGRTHSLETQGLASHAAPFGTSLRLGPLGYSSTAQGGIEVDYNSLRGFVAALQRAMHTPHASYRRIGVLVDGVYRQLSANLLQIENEFYAPIRPKRPVASGCSASVALLEQGVEYIELRGLDLDPFAPIGVAAETLAFLDLLLLGCLLAPSPPLAADELRRHHDNLQQVVHEGRRPGLTLDTGDGRRTELHAVGRALLEQLAPLAERLDRLTGGGTYAATLSLQTQKLDDPDLTPSARIMQAIEDSSFFEFGMHQALTAASALRAPPLAPGRLERLRAEAAESLAARQNLEAADEPPFADYLEAFLAQSRPD